MSTLVAVVAATAVVPAAGALALAIRARLAAVDEEARRRGHIVIGSHRGTRIYSSAQWTERRMERARAEAEEQRRAEADTAAHRRQEYTALLLAAAQRNAATPQDRNTATAVQP